MRRRSIFFRLKVLLQKKTNEEQQNREPLAKVQSKKVRVRFVAFGEKIGSGCASEAKARRCSTVNRADKFRSEEPRQNHVGKDLAHSPISTRRQSVHAEDKVVRDVLKAVEQADVEQQEEKEGISDADFFEKMPRDERCENCYDGCSHETKRNIFRACPEGFAHRDEMKCQGGHLKGFEKKHRHNQPKCRRVLEGLG